MNPPETEDDAGAGDTTMEPDLLHLIESLLQSISKTQSFKTKWSQIKTKLSDLKSHLSDVSTFPPNSNSISGDLLISLSETLSDALSLSLTCHTSNSNLPKLKTQNDVDSISAKLNNLIGDLHVLTRNEPLLVLNHHQNDVVSSSSVRVELKNLITRLQIGSGESRNSALNSLLNLIGEDDKNVLIAVSQGVIPVLIRLLDSGYSPQIIEKTVTAIARVSTIDSSNKNVLMAEGLLLLHYLIRILDSGTGIAIEKACITLQTLTLSKENATAIGSRGGISSLLEISQSGTPSSQAFAAAVLRNLAVFSDIRHNFMEEHAISVLLTLASSGTSLAQEYSISCLSNLVREDDDLKLLIARKGGIGSLKSFWDSAVVVRSLEVAVEFLSNLASDQRLIEFIISNGFLNRLIIVLNCGVLGVRIHAAEAIFKIGYNTKTRKELGENGFIPPLIKMLTDGKAIKEIEASSKALSIILMYAENVKIYRKEKGGIMSVIRLLDSGITNLDKKHSVSILMSLTRSMKCRKEMVKLGVLLHLQKLVEMEVEGAKKLQEVINGGKLWGVFKKSSRT